MLEFFLFVEFF